MAYDPFINQSQDRGGVAMPSLKEGQWFFNRRYELVRKLGAGGMGVVWLAQDHTEETLVALKFLPTVLVQHEGEMKRLKEEVRAGKELRHPGIVATYALEVEGSTAAMVIEYVEGKTLAELLAAQERGFFEPAEITGWARDLAETVDYLHRDARRIHRDIKPANILVDSAGRVRLMDFGISRRVQESVTRHSKTSEGHCDSSATLAYASPQQLAGKPAHPADDLYSLGALLYELLTGTPPFFRGNAEEVRGQVKHEPVTPLMERRAELVSEGLDSSMGEKVSAVVETAVLACLAKELEKRPASAKSVCEAFTTKSGPLTPLSGAARAEPPTNSISGPRSPVTGQTEQLSGASLLDDGFMGKQVEVILPGGVKLALCFCPPGTFTMGSPHGENGRTDDEEQVQVTLTQPFWLARTALTQAQWSALTKKARFWRIQTGKFPSRFKGDTLPVENVSAKDADEFIERLNEHVPCPGWRWELPSEAQWEYACRAGSPGEWGWVRDNRMGTLDEMGWFGGKACNGTRQVGIKKPNVWGLYDMHGNVWEWCRDHWDGGARLPGGKDPLSTSGDGRVNRGGSWRSNGPSTCRAAYRYGNSPDDRGDNLGFRPALVPNVKIA
jgi:formylglycine-generating enzyme required for sulfatase activity